MHDPNPGLSDWAERWVALGADDQVRRDAETLRELMALVEREGLADVEIMRAPNPGEPVLFGPG